MSLVAAQNLSEKPTNLTGSREAALVRLTSENITLVNTEILVILDLVPPKDIQDAIYQARVLLTAAKLKNENFEHA